MGEKNLFKKNFGETLKLGVRFTGSKKLTLAEIAELTNLDDDYLGKIERGEKLPSVHILFKIFVGLGISIDKLFTEIKLQIDGHEDAGKRGKKPK